MTVIEVMTRVRVDGGACVERLVCHPALPLVAGLDSERPAVHVWDFEAGGLRQLETIGGDSAAYADGPPSWEPRWPPGVAWHPGQPLLLAATERGISQWAPKGASQLRGLPPACGYRDLAFSPDGQALWASPSAAPASNPHSWEYCSDVISLASGAVTAARWWDTGVALHPGGGLVATLSSEQAATHVLFARLGGDSSPAAMRVLRRAVILAADGYETPVLSADGRHLAIRGNAYENSLEVFEFPSLTRVLATVLGEPYRSGQFDPDRDQQYRAWSRHNIAFGAQPGVLWAGTPSGTLVEIGLDNHQAARHDLLDGSRVTALCATASGHLIIATGEGDLVLAAVRAESPRDNAADIAAPQALVAAFLRTTSDAADDGELEEQLVVTDGTRTWEPGDLNAVTTAAKADPIWLRHRAAINKLFTRETG